MSVPFTCGDRYSSKERRTKHPVSNREHEGNIWWELRVGERRWDAILQSLQNRPLPKCTRTNEEVCVHVCVCVALSLSASVSAVSASASVCLLSLSVCCLLSLSVCGLVPHVMLKPGLLLGNKARTEPPRCSANLLADEEKLRSPKLLCLPCKRSNTQSKQHQQQMQVLRARAHTHTLTLTHKRTYTLSHSLTQTHTHTHKRTNTLSLIYINTHTDTHSHTLTDATFGKHRPTKSSNVRMSFKMTLISARHKAKRSNHRNQQATIFQYILPSSLTSSLWIWPASGKLASLAPALAPSLTYARAFHVARGTHLSRLE